MQIEVYDINGSGNALTIDVALEDHHAGGQGRVFRASHTGESIYCLKALPGVRPGDVAAEIKVFSDLTARARQGIDNKGPSNAIRESLRTFLNYLPTHAGYGKLPGMAERCLLFFRRFCDGASLQALTAPDRAEPSFECRRDIAKRLVRLLTTLEVYGFVHLDPYPDNIFVNNIMASTNMEVSLIDLEGIGVIGRNSRGFIDPRAGFVRLPTAYGKPGFWVLPNWFPKPGMVQPYEHHYIEAAQWQMLSILIFVLTWGARPFCWLSPQAFQSLASTANSDQTREVELSRALQSLDSTRDKHFLAKLDGNRALKDQLQNWFISGMKSQSNLPTARAMQSTISQLLKPRAVV